MKISKKVIYIHYNYDHKHFLRQPDPENRFYGYGFSGKYARKFKKYYPEYEIEVWRLDSKVKKYYEKEFEDVLFRIFPSFQISKLGDFSLRFLLELKKEKKNNPIINVCHIHYWLLYQIAFFFPNWLIVAQHHGEYSPFYRYKTRKGIKKYKALLDMLIEKRVLKHVDYFFLIDKLQVDYIKKAVLDIKYLILGSGVDFEEMRPIEKEKARKLIGWDLNKKYILYVGKLYELKQADVVISIWNEIKKNRHDIELVIIGNTQEDKFYKFAMDSGAKVLGRILQKDLYKYYSASDVYLLMSLREDYFGGIGGAVIESLGCNTPVVSYSLMNYSGENIFELGEAPKTIGETKIAILKILENSSRYTNLQERVEKIYSWKAISEQTAQIYRSLQNLRNHESMSIELRRISRAFCEQNIDSFLSIACSILDNRIKWNRDNFLKEGLPLKWELSYAALVDSEPVGFLFASKRRSDTVHIHLFIVKNILHSLGIGGLLLRNLEHLHTQYEFSKIDLWVYADSERAIDFYKKRNYEIVSERMKGNYKLYLMEKSLGAKNI